MYEIFIFCKEKISQSSVEKNQYSKKHNYPHPFWEVCSILIHILKFFGCHSKFAFEASAEVLRIIKSYLEGNF